MFTFIGGGDLAGAGIGSEMSVADVVVEEGVGAAAAAKDVRVTVQEGATGVGGLGTGFTKRYIGGDELGTAMNFLFPTVITLCGNLRNV
jgi:hypothetical protein